MEWRNIERRGEWGGGEDSWKKRIEKARSKKECARVGGGGGKIKRGG